MCLAWIGDRRGYRIAQRELDLVDFAICRLSEIGVMDDTCRGIGITHDTYLGETHLITR